MVPLLKYASEIGQAALLRKAIANEFGFSCHLDASLLSHTISTFDAALVNEVRAHYHDPEKHPAPGGKGGDTVLAELTNFLESSGGSDPLAKIYVTSDPLEGLSAALLLFTVTYSPKFVYDRNFGTLVRAKPKYTVDSAPMVVGMATVLKQYHPSVTRQVRDVLLARDCRLCRCTR
jgi:WASH complex subunit strumpellin